MIHLVKILLLAALQIEEDDWLPDLPEEFRASPTLTIDQAAEVLEPTFPRAQGEWPSQVHERFRHDATLALARYLGLPAPVSDLPAHEVRDTLHAWWVGRTAADSTTALRGAASMLMKEISP